MHMLYQITSNIICISLVCLHQQLFYSFDNSQLPGSSSVKRGIYSQFLPDLLALGKKRHCLPEQVFVSARTNSHTCIYISFRNIGKHPYIMNTDQIRSDQIRSYPLTTSSIFSTRLAEGSLSPAGSSGPSLTHTALTSSSSA